MGSAPPLLEVDSGDTAARSLRKFVLREHHTRDFPNIPGSISRKIPGSVRCPTAKTADSYIGPMFPSASRLSHLLHPFPSVPCPACRNPYDPTRSTLFSLISNLLRGQRLSRAKSMGLIWEAIK